MRFAARTGACCGRERQSGRFDRQNILGATMMVKKPIYVAVVDADISLRESLPDLLGELGYEAQGFSSVQELLEADKIRRVDCLVVDIATPGLSGRDLQRELERNVPIIFIVPDGVKTIHPPGPGRGAAQYLRKPFNDTALLEALRAALKP
jgi:FixJ family two-component response regulator